MEKVRRIFRFRVVSSDYEKFEAIAEMEFEGFKWVSSSKVIRFVSSAGTVYERDRFRMRFQKMEKVYGN